MSSTGTPTPQSIFGNMLATLKSDLLADLKAPLLDAAIKIQANPTAPELIAQGIALQGALIGQTPVGETQGIKAGADALVELIKLIP